MITDIIIAVRGGPDAKSRCAAALPPHLRSRLVEAMLDDMLDAAFASSVRASPACAAVHVVTPTEAVARQAARRGAQVLLEPSAGGIDAAFDRARRALPPRPGGIVVLLPGDLPTVTSAELATLVAGCAPGRIVVVPATMDGGTGALALPPDCTMPTHFGPGSFQRHCLAAAHAGLIARVTELPGIGFDVDRPTDLEALCRGGSTTHAAALVRRATLPFREPVAFMDAR